MKINGTIFSKPQQDQLKRGIGAELDKIAAKIDDVLNYMGDWVSGTEYHENDVVTYNGNLYEVVQSGTSNTTPDASPSMYKAMTETKYIKHSYTTFNDNTISEIKNILQKAKNGKNVFAIFNNLYYQCGYLGETPSIAGVSASIGGSGNVNGAVISIIRVKAPLKRTVITVAETQTTIISEDVTAIDILEEV